MNNQQPKQCIEQLKQVQSKIMNGLQQLNNLNSKYKMRTQSKFINTFLHIMNRMSNQLVQAQENYRNIDREIQTDKKCVQLCNELTFFKNQCISLKKQLQSVKLQLHKQKSKNQALNQQAQELNNALTKKIKLVHKYKAISLSEDKQRKKNNRTAIEPVWKSIDLQKQDQEKDRSEKVKQFLRNKLQNRMIFDEQKDDMLRSYRPRASNNNQRYVAQGRPITKAFNRTTLNYQKSPFNRINLQVQSSRRSSKISQIFM